MAFAAAYQLARPHPGQIAVAAELRHLLRESTLQTGHHASSHKVQDPYSLRCVPQVHGAVRDALDHLRRVLDIELNSATDNPLVFPGGGVAAADTLATGGGRVISGGNFHGEPIALALDFAKMALAELGSISERRIRAAGGRAPERRAATVPRGRVGHRFGDDDLPVHRRRPRLGAQGAGTPGVGRFDPDERQPGGPRVDGVHRGPARADRPAGRRADRRDRTACSARRPSICGSGWSPDSAPGLGVAEALARIRERVAHLDEDREPGPDLAAAYAIVHDGELVDLADGPGH